MAPPQKQKERSSDSTSASSSKPLVILAKPPEKQNKIVQSQGENVPSSPTTQKELKPPTLLQKSRDSSEQDGSRAASPGGSVSPSGSQSVSKETEAFADFVKNVSQKVYHIQQKPSSSSSQSSEDQKLNPPPEMASPVKLIDESLQWCDNALEYLQDGGDFYVIGVLGLQGTGKSTVMSLIAGCPAFKVQTVEMKEVGEHCTSGIDIFVTNQRVILLDAQPLLSASVMDHMIQYEKYEKKPLGGSDYYSAESTLYIQSMQLAAFLMCVCHTVVTVQDWFIDLNYIRFLLSCEMVKPAKPMLQFDSKSEIVTEHFPLVVFVQNRCNRKDFLPSSVVEMKQTLDSLLRNSKMRYTGSVQPNIHPQPASEECPSVNLLLLPLKEEPEDLESDQFREYRGRASYEYLSRSLASQILSMPRHLMTYFATSEKSWFYYATRMWDTVKKSNDFNEYRRHLVSIP